MFGHRALSQNSTLAIRIRHFSQKWVHGGAVREAHKRVSIALIAVQEDSTGDEKRGNATDAELCVACRVPRAAAAAAASSIRSVGHAVCTEHNATHISYSRL